MIVSFKDTLKFIGIIVIACCAVLVCNLFLNYDIDLRALESVIDEGTRPLYDALLMNDKVVCAVAGGCLVLTSVIMLVFYIGHYIENKGKKFGILKALGYGNFKISLSCAVFGACVFIGAIIGFAISWAIMPSFYAKQNDGSTDIPQVVMKFHASLPFLLVILPSVLFGILSVFIAWVKLNIPAISLIKGNTKREKRVKERKERDGTFLRGLALNVLNEKKLLAFFVAFGSFCFSAMIQMGLSMRDYASDMMGLMMLIIGVVLAVISLWLALTTVVNGNAKKIAMLKVNGYSLRESALAVLGLYHIPAIIGFVVGCVYQWGLLNVMVNVVFSSFDNVPVYHFDWVTFAICLPAFIVSYGGLNVLYALKISRTPIKTVMSE